MDTSFTGPFQESVWSDIIISKNSYRKCLSVLLTDIQVKAFMMWFGTGQIPGNHESYSFILPCHTWTDERENYLRVHDLT